MLFIKTDTVILNAVEIESIHWGNGNKIEIVSKKGRLFTITADGIHDKSIDNLISIVNMNTVTIADEGNIFSL